MEDTLESAAIARADLVPEPTVAQRAEGRGPGGGLRRTVLGIVLERLLTRRRAQRLLHGRTNMETDEERRHDQHPGGQVLAHTGPTRNALSTPS